MIYYYPVTGKSGLGNKLFPWARAVLQQEKNGGKILAPDWANYIKIGTYLRKEKDKRHYINVFNNAEYIKGLRKWWLLKNKVIISEKNVGDSEVVTNTKDHIVLLKSFVGEGISPYFESLLDNAITIKTELYRIVNQRLLPKITTSEPFIGVHIRLGDFTVPRDLDEIRKANALYFRLPMEWYLKGITQLRSQLGFDMKVKIFTDGTKEQLSEVLKLTNVELVEGGAAITDLLHLSNANVILASGSTFSMWAAFLEQKPSIWFTGLRRGHLIQGDTDYIFQPEWESGNFNKILINKILSSIL